MKQILLTVGVSLLLALGCVNGVLAEDEQVQTQSAPVQINSADAKQFATLPGIGPSIAQRIVDYRSAHGPFAQVDDLKKVKGIGTKTLESIRPLVALK